MAQSKAKRKARARRSYTEEFKQEVVQRPRGSEAIYLASMRVVTGKAVQDLVTQM